MYFVLNLCVHVIDGYRSHCLGPLGPLQVN